MKAQKGVIVGRSAEIHLRFPGENQSLCGIEREDRWWFVDDDAPVGCVKCAELAHSSMCQCEICRNLVSKW